MRSDLNSQFVEPSDENQITLTDRSLAGWEIASVVSSIVIAEWMAATAAGYKAIIAVPVALAIVLVISSHVLRRESLRDVGFRFDNFLKALSLLAIPVAVAALLCLVVGWKLGASVNFLRWHPGQYLVWALAQQYVLQGFVNRRAIVLAGRGWRSVLIVAAVFALLHLPNIWLTVFTFAGSLIWATVYQRVPNLFALAITHSAMTWFIVSTLPARALHHLRVGLGYFF